MKKLVLIALATFVLGVIIGHNVNVYNGLNKGVTWGTVGGCEIVGDPGCWKGDR